MPRKPTTPYGYIAFNKSGKVRKHISRLSDDKRKQEEEVARQFCDFFGRGNATSVSYEMLDECDQDFLLTSDDGQIEIQITEIVQREYLTELGHEKYRHEQIGFTDFYAGENGKIFGVDTVKRDGMIAQRISDKCAKNYQPPAKRGLWLLIFASDVLLSPRVISAGERAETNTLLVARNYCNSNGCAPFGQVWFMSLGLAPQRIWPPEDSRSL